MIASVLTVAGKVLVMFLIVGVGYVCYKKRTITSRDVAQLTNLLLYVVGPCLIIAALQTDSERVSMGKILLTVLLFPARMIAIAVAMQLVLRRQTRARAGMLRYGAVYSNCGFMDLPPAQAILGSTGVMYASTCAVAFNLSTWTHGYIILGGIGEDHRQTLRKALLNPGTINFAIGLPLYALSISLPEPLVQTLDPIGAMNMPLATIAVGTYLAKLSLRDVFSGREVYLVTALRLVMVPVASSLLLWLLRPDPIVMVTTALLMATPVRVNSVSFAIKLDNDTQLACKMIALSMLLSILIIPAITVLAQNLAFVP